MKIKLQCFCILLALLAGIHQSAAQGTTAFTYQGQLHDGGTNANGTYTMIFKLYDASTIGNQIGSTITTSPTLANGLFSVNLDFGNVFNGNALWLDITVTNGGTIQTLSPRVQMLPTPYALYSSSTASATTAANLASGTWSASVGNIQGDDGIVSNIFLLYDNGSLVMGLGTNGGLAPSLSAIPHNIQVFNASGTFVVPPYVTTIMVEVWGGGGGGGGSGSVSTNGFSGGNGGGGGGGGYGKDIISVTPGSNMVVTVGSGGAGGANGVIILGVALSGGTGGTGGTSSVGSVSATGGAGGQGGAAGSNNSNGNAGNGGNPGTSTAKISINGGQGGGGNNSGGSNQPGGAGANGGFGGVGSVVGRFPGSFQVGQRPGGGGASGGGSAVNNGADGSVIIYY